MTARLAALLALLALPAMAQSLDPRLIEPALSALQAKVASLETAAHFQAVSQAIEAEGRAARDAEAAPALNAWRWATNPMAKK